MSKPKALRPPDRFERMVWKMKNNTSLFERNIAVSEVAKLLRREHAAVRRLVLKLQKPFLTRDYNCPQQWQVAKADMCADILAALDKRRK